MPRTEKQKQANREYMRRNYHSRKENAKWQKQYREDCKDRCFSAYGGYVCVCCGETTKTFLTLDHKNNDGAQHRKEIGYRGGYQLYLWIIRNNFPPLFQVLCFNCNHGKQLNGGICPHQEQVAPANLLQRIPFMSHSFEHSRPDHMVIEKHIPEGHAHLDQKFDKGMRSPMLGQLPMENGLASPEVAGGAGTGEGGF